MMFSEWKYGGYGGYGGYGCYDYGGGYGLMKISKCLFFFVKKWMVFVEDKEEEVIVFV